MSTITMHRTTTSTPVGEQYVPTHLTLGWPLEAF